MKNTAPTIAALLALTAIAAEAHTVTFRRLNGTVLQTAEVAHGADATELVPAAPAESGFSFSAWDGAEKLACVAGDVTCWALYEATSGSEKSPSTSIASQSVAVRETPYSLDEYFQLYDNLVWSDEFWENRSAPATGQARTGRSTPTRTARISCSRTRRAAM